jgi:hypothetical protein
VSFPLYFDEDQNDKVATRLIKTGFDVLTTLAAGRAHQRVPDEDQLSFAASEGRAIVSGNVADFHALYRKWWDEGRRHAGIIVVSQRKQPSEIYRGLVRLQELYPDGIENLILAV